MLIRILGRTVPIALLAPAPTGPGRGKPTCILTIAASLSENDKFSRHDGIAEALLESEDARGAVGINLGLAHSGRI